MRFEEIDHRPPARGLGTDHQPQVRPVEAVHEHVRRAHEQLGDDIAAGGRIGGRGQGDDLRAAELRLDGAQRQVFGSKVVAPLRDAVRLVDRQQAHIGALEQAERIRLGQALRRNVQEPQVGTSDAVEDLPVLGMVVCRVEARGGNSVGAQLRHLIAHQRDQRRYHYGEAAAQDCRQLIAQRLATAGRHHGEHVAAGEDGTDDLVLARPERREAEDIPKRRLRLPQIGHGPPLFGAASARPRDAEAGKA